MNSPGLEVFVILLINLLDFTQVVASPSQQNDTTTSLHLELVPGVRNIIVTCRSLHTNTAKFRVKWSDSRRLLGDVYTSDVINGSMSESVWGLVPCTTYQFQVTALDRDDGEVDGVATEESITLPEGPPQLEKFSLKLSRSDTVTVAWQHPKSSCAVTYVVTYSGRRSWGDRSELNKSVVFQNPFPRNEVTLDNLEPYSRYNVCLVAMNMLWNSSVECTEAETDEAEPTQPLGLALRSVGYSDATVEWRAPENINGVFGHYRVTWYRHLAMNDTEAKLQAMTSGQSYTIRGLDQDTRYTVEVIATNGAGQGVPVRTVFKTKIKEIPEEVKPDERFEEYEDTNNATPHSNTLSRLLFCVSLVVVVTNIVQIVN